MRNVRPEEAIEAIRAYEDKNGKTPFADLALPTEDDDYLITRHNGSEKMIQALLETFYKEISSYDVGEELTELSAYLNYARDQAQGRTVLLAFTEGKWSEGDHGFLKDFKHTASLEVVNGQVKMRNSVSNPKESNTNHQLAQALIEKNGANVFWYPPKGELTVETLQAFRNSLPIEALEIELCGKTGCLCDPALNEYGIDLNVTVEQRSKFRHPWTAMKMYVEKTRVDTRPCGEDNTLYATVDIPGYYTDTLVYTDENCMAVNSVFTDGDGSLLLNAVPTIRGLNGTSVMDFQDMVTIMLHPQLPGPGTYTGFGFLVNGVNIEIELLADGVRDNDDSADMVWFQAKTGEVALDEFGTDTGDVISGTFDVVIEGSRVACSGASCEGCDGDEGCHIQEDVSGTLKGHFYGKLRKYDD